ncbi:MAG: desulfoferrodoxin Dfx [Lachnospiraceae bacterium]|nr:desulfoferrodoxin Dfx [Lachnospiraceae bacterium]
MELRFFKCAKCGQMVLAVKKKGCDFYCCGQPMEELNAGTTDASLEKHVPAVEVEGSTVNVTVGSVEHPMLEAHYIEFIAIQTKYGCQMKKLVPGASPKASFVLAEGDELEAVFEHCNLHGLWKA